MVLESLKSIVDYTAKKSTDVIDIAKVNLAISSKRDERKKVFMQIGKKLYDSRGKKGQTEDGAYDALFSKVERIDAEVFILRQRLARIVGLPICRICGAGNPKESIFCSKCGCKLTMQNVVDDTDECASACCAGDDASCCPGDVDTAADSPDSGCCPDNADAATDDTPHDAYVADN